MAGELAASIGANFSNYQGNPGLGGFGLGFGKIDTRPLEDLAKYTMLYNRAEWEKRQAEQEKAAAEMAKFAGLNLATTIPKDAKVLQEKFDKTIQYIRENPDALSYAKNKEKWLEYNKMKADLENDILFGATRSLMNVARKEKISAVTNEKQKAFLEAQLQKDIDATDIRTSLPHDQKYDVKPLDFGANKGVEVDVTKAGSNQIFQRDFTLFDIQEAKRAGANAALTGIRDPNSVTGQLEILDDNENPWIQMSGRLNQAIAGAKDPQTGVVDVTKLDGVPGIENVKAYNEYINRVKSDINAGLYRDKLGNKITFGSGPFRADDYTEINLNDGIDAAELGIVAQFSKWAGDQYKTKVIQTNDRIEQDRLAIQRAQLALDRDKFDEIKKNQGTKFNSNLVTADSVLSAVSNAIRSHKVVDVPDPSTKTGTKRYLEISDINLIERFGKTGSSATDEMGNTIPNDRLFYAQDEDRFYLGSKGADGKVNIGTQFTVDDWTDNLTAGKMGATDRGDVNTIVSEVLRNFGNDALKFAYGYNGISPTIEKGGGTTTSSTESTKTSTTTLSDADAKLSDADYYKKHKKFKPKG